MSLYRRGVDIRGLVKDLYDIYRSRKWMYKVNTIPIYNRTAYNIICSGIVLATFINTTIDWLRAVPYTNQYGQNDDHI